MPEADLWVDVEMERRFHALRHDEWRRWWAWLAEVVGRDLGGLRIRELTLGSGVLLGLIETGDLDPDDPDRFEVIPVTWPAPIPPPCWPHPIYEEDPDA